MSNFRCDRPGCTRPKATPIQYLALDPLGTGLIEPDFRGVDGDGRSLARSLCVRLCDPCTKALELWWTDRNAYDTEVRRAAIPRIAAASLRMASKSMEKAGEFANRTAPSLRAGVAYAHEKMTAVLLRLAATVEATPADDLSPELLASVRQEA